MSALHQILAVETDLKKQFEKISQETKKMFQSSSHYFQGKTRQYEAFSESDKDIPSNESKNMITTVLDRISYTNKVFENVINVIAQKEYTNTVAKADIVVENEVGESTILAKDVPATVLLSLESKLTELRGLYSDAPTLDGVKSWREKNGVDNVFTTEPTITVRSVEEKVPVTLSPATDKHPAQVQLIGKAVPKGKFTTVEESGELTPKRKHEILNKIDNLLMSVKKARAKANETLVNNSVKIGKNVLNYIME